MRYAPALHQKLGKFHLNDKKVKINFCLCASLSSVTAHHHIICFYSSVGNRIIIDTRPLFSVLLYLLMAPEQKGKPVGKGTQLIIMISSLRKFHVERMCEGNALVIMHIKIYT